MVCKNQSSLACEHCRKYVCHVHQAKHVCAEYKKLVADHVASHSHTRPKCSAIDCEQVSQVKCVHCLQNFCTAHRQPHYCVWEHCKFPGCRSSSSITLSTPCRYCDDFYCDSHVKVHEVTCPKRPPISPPCSQGSLLDDGTDSDSEDQLEGRGGPMPETPRGGTAAALSPVGRTASSPVASRARAVAVAWPTKAEEADKPENPSVGGNFTLNPTADTVFIWTPNEKARFPTQAIQLNWVDTVYSVIPDEGYICCKPACKARSSTLSRCCVKCFKHHCTNHVQDHLVLCEALQREGIASGFLTPKEVAISEGNCDYVEHLKAQRLQRYADSYVHIVSNDRSRLPKGRTLCHTPLSSPGARQYCACPAVKPCNALSDTCANALMKYECNEENCQCTACGNRDLQHGTDEGLLEIIHENKVGGAGATVTRGVPAGVLVGEYVGELVPAAEAERRLRQRARESMFELGPSFASTKRHTEGQLYFIDASVMGNITRFINHSCAPNCAVHQIIVHNEPRLAIYTCKPIAAGTPLSIAYNFDLTKPFAPWTCTCGAPACSSMERQQAGAATTSLHAYTDGSHFKGSDVGGWVAVFVLSKRIPTPPSVKPPKSLLVDIRNMEESEAATVESDGVLVELFGPVAKRGAPDIFNRWFASSASNNSSELTGVAEALMYFLTYRANLQADHPHQHLYIHTDSTYVIGVLGAARAPGPQKWAVRANAEMITEIRKVLEPIRRDVTFVKVKGHDHVHWNDRADSLAKRGVTEFCKTGRFASPVVGKAQSDVPLHGRLDRLSTHLAHPAHDNNHSMPGRRVAHASRRAKVASTSTSAARSGPAKVVLTLTSIGKGAGPGQDAKDLIGTMVDDARGTAAEEGTEVLDDLIALITSSELDLDIYLHCPNAAALYRQTIGFGLCGYVAAYQLYRLTTVGSDTQPDLTSEDAEERLEFIAWLKRGSFIHKHMVARYLGDNWRQLRDRTADPLFGDFHLGLQELATNTQYKCCLVKAAHKDSQYALVHLSNIDPLVLGPVFKPASARAIVEWNRFMMHTGPVNEGGHFHLIDYLPDAPAAFSAAIRSLALAFLAPTPVFPSGEPPRTRDGSPPPHNGLARSAPQQASRSRAAQWPRTSGPAPRGKQQASLTTQSATTPLFTDGNDDSGEASLLSEDPVNCTPDIISNTQARMVTVTTVEDSSAVGLATAAGGRGYTPAVTNNVTNLLVYNVSLALGGSSDGTVHQSRHVHADGDANGGRGNGNCRGWEAERPSRWTTASDD